MNIVRIILLSIFILLITAVVSFFYFCVDADHINVSEKRFFMYAGLICMLVLTFSILRLFNALVINNTYMLHLNKAVGLLTSEMKKVISEQKHNVQTIKIALTGIGNKADNLRDAINNLFRK